ncbi:hypothetical protein [Staphylococcus saprophyticus]|uniref:hypothetical protein n=1 Tax=Staphylococcus saprophyticus TaxID=29385 RepID=UPI001642B183|nr:hypothetical protein [Staphylococcus saprophyticus]
MKKNGNLKFGYERERGVMMIGGGRGIGGYGGYVEERGYVNVKGEEWLIFGNENYDDDFVYKDDLEEWVEEGVLRKLELGL